MEAAPDSARRRFPSLSTLVLIAFGLGLATGVFWSVIRDVLGWVE